VFRELRAGAAYQGGERKVTEELWNYPPGKKSGSDKKNPMKAILTLLGLIGIALLGIFLQNLNGPRSHHW
jgi:hypothetical protein